MTKMALTVINISVSAFFLAAVTGCSAFRSSTEPMSIRCTPTDSVLMVNGNRYTPPTEIGVKRNREVSIECYKEGFVPYQRTVGYHFNTTGALDAVGAALFLVPAVGLFTPGAWSLDETNVNISLIPK
jgi:hypothetical protein